MAAFGDGRIEFDRQVLRHGGPAHLATQALVAFRLEQLVRIGQQRPQGLIDRDGCLQCTDRVLKQPQRQHFIAAIAARSSVSICAGRFGAAAICTNRHILRNRHASWRENPIRRQKPTQ